MTVKPSNEKEDDQQQQQQQNLDPENPENPEPSRTSSSRSCSSALSCLFSLRCLIVMVLSLAIVLFAIFWLFPRRSPSDNAVKVTAPPIQAYFKLHKPASEVISHKGRLENEIFKSIGLPNINVTILSLKQSGSHDHHFTDVEFAVDLLNSTDHDSLTSLRSSFVNLFTQTSNLNLTKSSFGKASLFQVLKFPGGITIDPLAFNPDSRVEDVFFTFTLDISLSEIQDCLAQLTDQVGQILFSELEPPESIHFIFKNEQGSTLSPPVTVQVAFVSTMTELLEKRLDHFIQIIQTSINLGLDSSVFGQVKSITLSTIDSASVLALPPIT
ncbi:hypothetical protein V5N11_022141 [Cardamine amara subsp. amara]|uniref:DUF7036 domain-containing protein n=1 Tax=Cardamine amara subsp. amara TaxID=228776 RepID=A0ABD1C0I9_CARAN